MIESTGKYPPPPLLPSTAPAAGSAQCNSISNNSAVKSVDFTNCSVDQTTGNTIPLDTDAAGLEHSSDSHDLMASTLLPDTAIEGTLGKLPSF